MVATLTRTTPATDRKMFEAALAFAGLPANYKRIFQKEGEGLKATTIDKINPSRPVWVQMNQTKPSFPLRKPANNDITIYQNLTLDFEFLSNPAKALDVGYRFVQALIEQELAEPGQPVEDSGAGCHVVIPLIPFQVAEFGGGELVNEAVQMVVNSYYKPTFDKVLAETGLTGQMKLEGFDISRILSLPGTWRPGGLKENEHPNLLAGVKRIWIYPYGENNFPQRKENELVTELIKAACTFIKNEKEAAKPEKAKNLISTTDAASWIISKAADYNGDDRSVSFHQLVWATYFKFDENTVLSNATLIDSLTGEKYGNRADTEARRSLNKASRFPKIEWSDWIQKQAYHYDTKPANEGKPPTPPAADQTVQSEPLKQHHLTDLGNAKRLIERFGQDLRYVPEWGWLIWDGKRWQLDRTGAAKRYAKKTVATIYTEAGQITDDTQRRATAEHATKSEAKSKLDAMLTLAESESEVIARPEDFDRDPWLLNCLNGTLDLRTGQLLPHRRENLISKITPIPYDKSAECPTWITFLENIMADNYDLFYYIKRILGYSLTGLTTEQCLFLLWGTGRNGKSTLIETVTALLGDYGQISTFKTFLDKDSDGPNNDVAKLAGARFVSAVEADPGKRLAESVIKQLTGGDTVSARFLHKEFFDFKPSFKLFLAANHKPVIRGQDLGIWRRIKLIPFEVTIPENQIDKKLPEKLRAELPGILRWAVEGCFQWQRDGLMEPEEVTSATESYKEESDILRDFILECCVKGRKKEVELIKIFHAYTDWCKELGENAIGKRNFIDCLTQRGILLRPGRDNKRTFYGIGLKE